MVYLPAFTIKSNLEVNIPYMDDMGCDISNIHSFQSLLLLELHDDQFSMKLFFRMFCFRKSNLPIDIRTNSRPKS